MDFQIPTHISRGLSGRPRHAPLIVVNAAGPTPHVHEEESLEAFRATPKQIMMVHLPSPLFAAASFSARRKYTFLDFCKGIFIHVIDAEVYFPSGNAAIC